MSDERETEALIRWLEESGRALEMRVLRAFRQHTRARHSVHHTDQTSGKSREIDVMARFHGSRSGDPTSQLDVVIECKSGKPGSQWVAFRDESAPARFPPTKDVWLSPTKPGQKTRFEYAWDWDPPFADRVNASSIVTAHDGRDTAHGAVQQVLSAVDSQVEYLLREEVESKNELDESTGQSVRWSVPEAGVMGVIITTVPIYVAELGEDNTPRVSPVEMVAVPTGRIAPYGPAWIFVARESALPRVVRDLRKAADRL